MPLRLLSLIGLVLLSACSQANFRPEDIKLNAPDVVYYTPDRQAQAAAELMKCDAPQVFEMLADYHVMRQQSRLLRGEQ